MRKVHVKGSAVLQRDCSFMSELTKVNSTLTIAMRSLIDGGIADARIAPEFDVVFHSIPTWYHSGRIRFFHGICHVMIFWRSSATE